MELITYEKNNKLGLDPRELTHGSGKKVWWKCSKGHEWKAACCSRTRGNGCPYCAGKKVCKDNYNLKKKLREEIQDEEEFFQKLKFLRPDWISLNEKIEQLEDRVEKHIHRMEILRHRKETLTHQMEQVEDQLEILKNHQLNTDEPEIL